MAYLPFFPRQFILSILGTRVDFNSDPGIKLGELGAGIWPTF